MEGGLAETLWPNRKLWPETQTEPDAPVPCRPRSAQGQDPPGSGMAHTRNEEKQTLPLTEGLLHSCLSVISS